MTNCETLIFGVFIFKCIEILGVDVYRCLFCIKSWLFYNRVLFFIQMPVICTPRLVHDTIINKDEQ